MCVCGRQSPMVKIRNELFLTRDTATRRAAGIVSAAVGLLSVLAISNGMPWPHDNDLSVRLLTQADAGQPAVADPLRVPDLDAEDVGDRSPGAARRRGHGITASRCA